MSRPSRHWDDLLEKCGPRSCHSIKSCFRSEASCRVEFCILIGQLIQDYAVLPAASVGTSTREAAVLSQVSVYQVPSTRKHIFDRYLVIRPSMAFLRHHQLYTDGLYFVMSPEQIPQHGIDAQLMRSVWLGLQWHRRRPSIAFHRHNITLRSPSFSFVLENKVVGQATFCQGNQFSLNMSMKSGPKDKKLNQKLRSSCARDEFVRHTCKASPSITSM